MGLGRRIHFILAIMAAAVALPAWSAEPPPLNAYGDLPGIEDVAISPSGKNMAIIGRFEGKRQLLVLDAEHKARALVTAGDAKLRGLSWVGEDAVMLITSVTQTLDPIFYANKAELFGALIVPLDGTKPWLVFDETQSMAKSISGSFGTRLIDGKWQGFFSGTQFANTRLRGEIVGSTQVLAAVDLKTNSTRRVAELSSTGVGRRWLIDANGNVAATLEKNLTTGRWEIRNQQGRPLAAGIDPTGDVTMYCLGREGASVVYAAEDDAIGRVRWYEVPLAGGTPSEILVGSNVDRLYVDDTNGHMLGYLDGDTPHFFEPTYQAAIQKVFRAFPKLHVEIKEWTPSFSHLLVRTTGNGDSGSWYIVDMKRLAADSVGSERPLILPQYVGPISTITYKAADGMDLDGILTVPPGRETKNLPAIILPHGNGLHDTVTFDWWAQAFASRGYAVFQPNFRGSTNRDDAFRRAGYGQWGRKMQTDLSDGLAELAKRGIVDPKRACIMGASYGGYAALAGVTLQNGIYRCAVAVSPISDLRDFYTSQNRISGYGQVTWRSMQESLGNPSTFDEVSPRRHAAQADAPILMIHGKDDTIVSFNQSTAMASALEAAGKPNELVVLNKEDHQLSHAATRQQMLEAAMRFVQQYNPAN